MMRHILMAALLTVIGNFAWAAAPVVVPPVKSWQGVEGSLALAAARIDAPEELAGEVAALREALAERGVSVVEDGVVIRLRLAPVDIGESASKYRDAIAAQAYRLEIAKDAVVIEGASPAGVFYGIQTLRQLLAAGPTLPLGEVRDWPDLAVRSLMIDAARANENRSYYERVLRFCGRYKFNRLHFHLTDDENVSLYHEKYPQVLHPHAWRAGELAELVQLARRHHIEIVPEIESLGHARVFLRHPDYAEFLHRTTAEKPKKSWAGTSVPGITNVLCPSAPRALEYLDDMYTRAAEIFPFPETHIGLDEVDMTTCGACVEKFPGLSAGEWYLRHLKRCAATIHAQGRRVGVWGDMLLAHPESIDELPIEGLVIYDWHYNPDMTDKSAALFSARGFTVIGCPALVCHPHMVLPTAFNYDNIARFATIARTHDLYGLDTTVWTPIRYLSDALWPGIAFAASQAWGGSNWDEAAFFRGFAADFWGSPAGDAFGAAFRQLAAVRWWLNDFKLSCWTDEASLAAAAEKAAGEKGAKARSLRQQLAKVRKELEAIDGTIPRERQAWEALLRSVRILDYVLEHFLASTEVRKDGAWNRELLQQLDARSVELIGWIEADWDRNRFADDPFKADLAGTGQHLLDWFRKMNEYHRAVQAEEKDE